MSQKISPSTAALLIIPPMLWAGNAVVGRLVIDVIPPVMLNFLRWAIVFVLILPLGAGIFRRNSGIWRAWRRFSVLGLLGIGLYNTLQYLALHSSTPINVTLVAASLPIWMLLIGRIFFATKVSRRQWLGASVSILGVFVVLSHGQWAKLMSLHWVVGDLLILLATLCWAFYSWLLSSGQETHAIRSHWAHFLLAQVSFGLVWSGLMTGAEWWLIAPQITWSGPLVAALLYVAVGPSIIAFRCWTVGVQRVGPNVAAFFTNLTPLFAALLSLLLLGETPHLYHGAAFLLILGGIVLSSKHPA
jgi:drug/metabolite transporter (DMT)-like permease